MYTQSEIERRQSELNAGRHSFAGLAVRNGAAANKQIEIKLQEATVRCFLEAGTPLKYIMQATGWSERQIRSLQME